MAQSGLHPPGGDRDRTLLGIGIILLSVLAMAFADALVKLVSADLTVWQVFVVRSLFAIPFVAVLVRWAGSAVRVLSAGWVVFRSLLLVATWLLFYASLPMLPLSVAAVAVYTNPILIVLMSAAVLGEPVTVRQWCGVAVGFAGVLAILKPGTNAFSWATLLPLAAAALYAGAMVLTRSKCREEAPLVLALALHVAFLVAGLLAVAVLLMLNLAPRTVSAFPFLLATWPDMTGRDWAVLALLGALSGAYFAGVARAYQIAPPQVIATFDYGYLVSAALWGFVLFAEKPGLTTIAGMVLIIIAGLMAAVPAREKTSSTCAGSGTA